MVSSALPVTRVGSPPLIAAPAQKWSTMLTVMRQSQDIEKAVVGPLRKTVITLDLGLYQPAKHLQMSRTALNNMRPNKGVTRAHQEIRQSLKSLDIDTKMESLDQSSAIPLFRCK